MRLWRESDEASFERFTASEISRLDLSQIVLWLKASGMSADGVGLFEPPPAESLARAMRTLSNLGALDARGRLRRWAAKWRPSRPSRATRACS